MERQTHTIDATDKVLGRLATEVVLILRGKQKPGFVPYKDEGDFVVIKNLEKVRFTGHKLEQKKYFRHSGFLGNEKEIPMKKVFKEKPAEVLRRAVLGMLPKNKLRSIMIRRLKIS